MLFLLFLLEDLRIRIREALKLKDPVSGTLVFIPTPVFSLYISFLITKSKH
jgi:hypothetical protein